MLMDLVFPLLMLASLQAVPPRDGPQVRLELRCRDSATLLAIIHNDSPVEASVGLGMVMNGAKQLVSGLRVMVRKTGEPELFRVYRPSSYPAGGSFALAEWILSLPAGASYNLQLSAGDFEGWRKMTSFPASALELRWEVDLGPSKTALVSNEVHVPDHCR
jgi:hypothetical protein